MLKLFSIQNLPMQGITDIQPISNRSGHLSCSIIFLSVTKRLGNFVQSLCIALTLEVSFYLTTFKIQHMHSQK